MLEPVKLQDISYGRSTCYEHHTPEYVVCRLCGSDKTRIQQCNGMPLWVKDKNVYGNKIYQYLCYDCAYQNIDTRKCFICGNNKILHRIFGTDTYWTGKYECQSCMRKRLRKGKQHGNRRRAKET